MDTLHENLSLFKGRKVGEGVTKWCRHLSEIVPLLWPRLLWNPYILLPMLIHNWVSAVCVVICNCLLVHVSDDIPPGKTPFMLDKRTIFLLSPKWRGHVHDLCCAHLIPLRFMRCVLMTFSFVVCIWTRNPCFFFVMKQLLCSAAAQWPWSLMSDPLLCLCCVPETLAAAFPVHVESEDFDDLPLWRADQSQELLMRGMSSFSKKVHWNSSLFFPRRDMQK